MDQERRLFLLKLGYFPVTDDFWAGADMPHVIGQGFTWAFRMPLASQRFMPYHEQKLTDAAPDQLQMAAYANLSQNY